LRSAWYLKCEQPEYQREHLGHGAASISESIPT
jgi:hypothetical protein